MKTQSVLTKYQRILGGLLKIDPSKISFLINDTAGKRPTDYTPIELIKYLEPEKDENGEKTGELIDASYWRNWSEGAYKIMAGKEVLSEFKLYKMPHCCAILVSCNAFVSPKFRNMGIGTVLNTFRQDIGRLLGYSTLMCTDIDQNTHQRQLLQTNGWKDIYSVRNKRTNNMVHVSVINL